MRAICWHGKSDVRVDTVPGPSNSTPCCCPAASSTPTCSARTATAVKFVRAFFDDGKPVASICHGPWTLIEAGVVKGRRMTSWPSLKTDLQNAGATWENKAAVADNNLVTSRMPADIPAFNRQMIDLFAKARPVAAGS